jgi:hypothetical protein
MVEPASRAPAPPPRYSRTTMTGVPPFDDGAETDEPYGLPRFDGEDTLDGWTDHSDIAMRNVRIFTRGHLTATLIHHPALWDLILSDGSGRVETSLLTTPEIGARLRALADSLPEN